MSVLLIAFTEEIIYVIPLGKSTRVKTKVRHWVRRDIEGDDILYDKDGKEVSLKVIENAVMAYPKNERGFSFYSDDDRFRITEYQNYLDIMRKLRDSNGWTSASPDG